MGPRLRTRSLHDGERDWPLRGRNSLRPVRDCSLPHHNDRGSDLRVSVQDLLRRLQAWVGPATAQGRLPVRPPEFQPCGQPSNANLISGPSTGGSPGWLQMRYGWSSNTGNLQDLSTCAIGEDLSYSPTPWPNPPRIPTPGGGENTFGQIGPNGFVDDSTVPGSLQAPYASASVSGQQIIWYRCGCYMSGSKYYIQGPHAVDRFVSPNGNGRWKYNASKHGVTAEWNPLP